MILMEPQIKFSNHNLLPVTYSEQAQTLKSKGSSTDQWNVFGRTCGKLVLETKCIKLAAVAD